MYKRQVASAPTVTSQGVFSAPDPVKEVPSVAPPVAAAPVAPAPVAEVAVAQAPPIPAEGLPDGWSMEQWDAYGQMWLEQNGRA